MKRSDHDTIGRQLRDAGAALTAPASEQLHARVMADVRRERAAASSATTTQRTAGRWWMIGAAAAAVVAVVVTVWVMTEREPTTPPVAYRQVPSLPSVPSVEKVVVEGVELRAKLHEARFGYLDRDGKRLAHFLIRAVPGVPAQAKEEAARGL
jgi:hypothetical protein